MDLPRYDPEDPANLSESEGLGETLHSNTWKRVGEMICAQNYYKVVQAVHFLGRSLRNSPFFVAENNQMCFSESSAILSNVSLFILEPCGETAARGDTGVFTPKYI